MAARRTAAPAKESMCLYIFTPIEQQQHQQPSRLDLLMIDLLADAHAPQGRTHAMSVGATATAADKALHCFCTYAKCGGPEAAIFTSLSIVQKAVP
jgi:hypothetical protein